MTLEQGYFISQMIAATLLVLSVLFLARQVQQNARLIERMVNEDHRSSQAALLDEVIRNRDFALFHKKIGEEYELLDDVDKYRAQHLAQKNIVNVMRSVHARLDGDLPDRDWTLIEAHIRRVTTRKNVQEAWKRMKVNYSKQAQELWDRSSSA